MALKELNISPVGRVEGDLDVKVYMENGVVTRAHTQAAMFRGFEKILAGKDPQSGLIVTPRACGICGGSHLYCASSALDVAWKTTLPPNALLMRAIGQAAETTQSIPRWFYAIFATDMANKKFANKPLYQEVVKRFAAYVGTSFQSGVTASGRPVEVYALFGGQWPHSSYMIPGGVMCAPTLKDITRAHAIMNQFRNDWLETIWLGCSIERYMEIQSWDDLMEWLEENESHRNSDLGLFLRAGLEFGLDKFGQGVGKYLAWGTYLHKDMYNKPTIEGRNPATISPSGFFDGEKYYDADQKQVAEHIKHAWYTHQEEGLHPFDEPIPTTSMDIHNLENSDFGGKYSWSKAPRFMGHAAETGPLARVIMAANPANKEHQFRDPLFGDIMKRMGPSVFTRVLARMHEAPRLYLKINEWLSQVRLDDEFYIKPTEQDGIGWGATEAARGALAHWIKIKNGVIENYQIIAPTTFNVGPNDKDGNPGPIESALEGTEIEDPHDPVEVGMVARSFDSCLVCTVHAHDNKTGKQLAKFKL
ncbi:nickel-dependent hydrogenase large subunit [Flavilitoribacter nigricans]|uniref:Cytochrome-c3 hydrogenase n=1 Tax=Flavilitoribacter nigricans (strain ATCC 23147 / DSM 23189 / NBRC 102662 / NCIMB 1420 / SS-2) TaxID=1122177 RepID=A0A2D0N5Z0_FLAN2|nr:nickel-dependent hydrogenase large subunit [Flavilitoribacter nigricans]PHN03818.1 cytochrome-c3 hydrogenase [Flavilitoribacter nigricans DSM 23189 = NBRC 102662]